MMVEKQEVGTWYAKNPLQREICQTWHVARSVVSAADSGASAASSRRMTLGLNNKNIIRRKGVRRMAACCVTEAFVADAKQATNTHLPALCLYGGWMKTDNNLTLALKKEQLKMTLKYENN